VRVAALRRWDRPDRWGREEGALPASRSRGLNNELVKVIWSDMRFPMSGSMAEVELWEGGCGFDSKPYTQRSM